MTTQEAYEKIRAYFSRDGADLAYEAYDDGARKCLYRTADGRKCAVGCLIPDELYRPRFEGNAVDGIVNTEDAALRELLNGKSVEGARKLTFLVEAQEAHDGSMSVREFIERLDELAAEHNLNVAATA